MADQLLPRLRSIERMARRKLLYLYAARRREDPRPLRRNHLEARKGDRTGQHGIRINERWRICFR